MFAQKNIYHSHYIRQENLLRWKFSQFLKEAIPDAGIRDKALIPHTIEAISVPGNQIVEKIPEGPGQDNESIKERPDSP